MNSDFLASDHYRNLEARYRALKGKIAEMGWLTDGSVTPNQPGRWRWTRKVKAKTLTVGLSQGQADLFRAAIANHRKLEEILREMRAISQEVLLNSVEGVRRKRQPQNPKSPLS